MCAHASVHVLHSRALIEPVWVMCVCVCMCVWNSKALVYDILPSAGVTDWHRLLHRHQMAVPTIVFRLQRKRMSGSILSSDNQKRRNCDGLIAHWPFFYYFLLKGEEPPTCIGCDKRLTIEHILLTCSDFIEIRESHFTAKSLRMLFKNISPEKIFNFLKEINILGKM